MCLIELPVVDIASGQSSNERLNYKDMLVVKSHNSGDQAIAWMLDRTHPGRILQVLIDTTYASVKNSLLTTWSTHYADADVSKIGDAINDLGEECLLRKENARTIKPSGALSCSLIYQYGPAILRVDLNTSYLLVLANLNS